MCVFAKQYIPNSVWFIYISRGQLMIIVVGGGGWVRERERVTVTKCPLFFHFFFFFSIYYCYVKLDYRRRRKKNWTECSNNHGHWPTVNCMNNSCSIIISFTEFFPPPKKNWIYQPNQTDQLANILCVCVCVSANTRMMTISIEFNFNSNSFPLHTHTHTANSFCDCYHTHTLFYSLKKMRTKKNFFFCHFVQQAIEEFLTDGQHKLLLLHL